MSKATIHDTPMLDELEKGPWPSFISGFKRLRDDHPDERINKVVGDLLGQLEHSYETRKGYWKGGTVSVFGYGGGIIPRFSEVGGAFPESKEFHTIRVQPTPGNYYTTDMMNQLADSWEKYGSGLITFHGQTGNIMFIGTDTNNIQPFFDEINEYGWDLGGAGPCVRTAMSCVGMARCEQSCTNEHALHRHLVNEFTDDVHRPALPYKFKFKVSGCPNDCQNAIERAQVHLMEEQNEEEYWIQALAGDSTDGIKGAKGVGLKGAKKIVQNYYIDNLEEFNFNAYHSYFPSVDEAILSMRLVRMDQLNQNKELELWENP